MSLFDPRVLGAPPADLRRERIEASPRYVDGRYRNTAPLRSIMVKGQTLGRVGRADRAPNGHAQISNLFLDVIDGK